MIGLPGGYEAVVRELHTGRLVRVIGFYPRTRMQRRRANDVVDMLRAVGLDGYVDEVRE